MFGGLIWKDINSNYFSLSKIHLTSIDKKITVLN